MFPCLPYRETARCAARQQAEGEGGSWEHSCIAGEPRNGARKRKNRWCPREERPSGHSAVPLKDLEPALRRLIAGDRALVPPVWSGVTVLPTVENNNKAGFLFAEVSLISIANEADEFGLQRNPAAQPRHPVAGLVSAGETPPGVCTSQTSKHFAEYQLAKKYK